ncbi:MAG TPA: hypothetical protein VNO50_23270 [Pyrinomonadaceae bacterium]|nr:hypothetical protein [Pyrinomonadaceae bacterium]
MKLRDVFVSAMTVCIGFVSANAFEVNTPSPLLAQDEVFRSAYYDTINILSASNECSDFFGGPSSSIDAFNELFARVGSDFLAPSIGIVMSGATTNVVSMSTGRKYRLFEKVTINRNGPFYRHRAPETHPTLSGVGRYHANTREARVLMLLHELGHVIEADGKWLLPDDGRDADVSRSNTRRIEDACTRQIRDIWKGEPAARPVNLNSESK